MRDALHTAISFDPASDREQLHAAWMASLGLGHSEEVTPAILSIREHALAGSWRDYDTEIADAIFCAAGTGQNVEVLEIAAGVSLPTESLHLGAPWLSRALAQRLKERIRITVSDINPSIQLIGISEHGVTATTTIDLRGELPLRVPLSESLDLAQTLWNQRSPGMPVTSEDLPPILQERARAFLSSHAEVTSLRVAPMLCRGIEQHFGIADVRVGVDALNLPAQFAQQRFEVVFARHLYQRLKVTSLAELAASIGNVLSPTGVGLLAFDRMDSAPASLWQIRPGGGYRQLESSDPLADLACPR